MDPNKGSILFLRLLVDGLCPIPFTPLFELYLFFNQLAILAGPIVDTSAL